MMCCTNKCLKMVLYMNAIDIKYIYAAKFEIIPEKNIVLKLKTKGFVWFIESLLNEEIMV